MLVKSFEYFIQIAEGSTFLDTASDYDISQSSLSKTIMRLEDEFGVRLLDRSHYPVTLTAAGKQLYADLKELIPGYRKLKRHMLSYSRHRNISCCVIPSFTDFQLDHIFSQFSDSHQKIVLDISRSSDPLKVIAALENDELDFSVMHKPFSVTPHLKVTPLTDDALYVLLPINHPLAALSDIPFSKLYNEIFFASFWSYTILRELCEDIDISELTIQKIDQPNTAREIIITNVSHGKGVAIFYESNLKLFNLNNIVVRPLAERPNNPLVLAMSAYKKLTQDQKEFCDYVVSVFRRNHTV
jgi:DNA-binding transcriptional LysR family regulator